MRRRSSISSKSPVNVPANRVRREVRIDAAGAAPGWAGWDHPRDMANGLTAIAVIRLRRDIVIVSPPWARSREAHARENATVAQKPPIICLLYVFNQRSWHGISVWMLPAVGDANHRQP